MLHKIIMFVLIAIYDQQSGFFIACVLIARNYNVSVDLPNRTKCCYGLTMDLLDNIATELGFEFHLYIVRDQLFGTKLQRNKFNAMRNNDTLNFDDVDCEC